MKIMNKDNEINIIPLGTVSPYCKDNYNCPGFLIKYRDKNILLDCGNGITSLLDFPDCLNNLHIFISHFHKDHFGDIGIIQYASYVYHNLNSLDKKINIYLPIEDFQNNKLAITSNTESFANYEDISDENNYILDDVKISFYNNHSHTIPSYMIKLEINDKKIVYTSDIGNSDINGLIKFCKNADVLICESSFIKSNNVMSKTHLHAYEAADIALIAGVKKLVLTHFWPSISKSEYLKEAQKIFLNTIVAEEGVKIKVIKNDK